MGFLGALLLCNALFFLDVEARPAMVMAFFGQSAPERERADRPMLTKMQLRQTRSFGFSRPASLDRAPR